MEGHLERSPHLSKHIPRGELIELLSKSLLYLEVESHWKGDALTSNCKSGFSLLDPHVCSLEPPKKLTQLPATPVIPISVAEPRTNGIITEPNGKRKSSPVIIEGPTEKRAKRDQEDMAIDTSSLECMVSRILLISTLYQRHHLASGLKVSSVGSDRLYNPSLEAFVKRTAKPKTRPQGPGDEATNPKAILLLEGHKSEVQIFSDM
jgi:transducin (beta)-like 1